MGSLTGFNAAQHETRSFEPIPEGWHNAIAVECEWKDTKAGTGRYLQFVFELSDGDFKGRKIWERLNLENVNQTAVDIAQKTFAELCRSVNVLTPDEPEELLYKPVSVKLANREYQGELRAEIKGYRPGGGAGRTAEPAAEFNDAAPSAPWKRG